MNIENIGVLNLLDFLGLLVSKRLGKFNKLKTLKINKTIKYIEKKFSNIKTLEKIHTISTLGFLMFSLLATTIYSVVNINIPLKFHTLVCRFFITFLPFLSTITAQQICGGHCPFQLLKRYYRKKEQDSTYVLYIKGLIPNLLTKYFGFQFSPRNIIKLLFSIAVVDILILLLIFIKL